MSSNFIYKHMKDKDLKNVLKEQVVLLHTRQKELDSNKISFNEFQECKNNIDCVMKNSLKELWERHNDRLIADDVSEEDLLELDEIRRNK